MALYCDFSGSYYDQAPWTHEPCMAETSVPAGCPVHFVTGAPIDPQQLQAFLLQSDGTKPQTPSSATVVGSDDRTFTLPDEFSCDCTPTQVGISFQRIAVDIPAATAGDSVTLWGVGYEAGPLEIEFTAPAPCPEPQWPEQYSVGLACDRCPDPDTDGDGVPDDQESDFDVGCAVGGDPSVILAGLALLPLLRRRRTKIVSSR